MKGEGELGVTRERLRAVFLRSRCTDAALLEQHAIERKWNTDRVLIIILVIIIIIIVVVVIIIIAITITRLIVTVTISTP